jgi:hypothetical protein
VPCPARAPRREQVIASTSSGRAAAAALRGPRRHQRRQLQDSSGATSRHDLPSRLAALGDLRGASSGSLGAQLGGFTSARSRRENRAAVFFPSSIAAFGPSTPRAGTPQDTLQRPNTIYGVTKVAGELLGDYYAKRFGVDVRGLRFPGLISYTAPPGGGTTDYAVAIFYEALRHGSYECFLGPDTRLDMMYMPDAVRAILELMDADPAGLRHRNAFNITAMNFTPTELAT